MNSQTNTPEADETMPAGRSLDALVAEKVMGWTDWWVDREGPNATMKTFGFPPGVTDTYSEPPHYSTDIADAWLVVEKLRKDGCPFLFGHNRNPHNGWFADFLLHPLVEYADTAPLAVCRAALKAVGA